MEKYVVKIMQVLGQLLDARQLGLKLIANVTYGYTSANFSGRMPCVEVLSLINSLVHRFSKKYHLFIFTIFHA